MKNHQTNFLCRQFPPFQMQKGAKSELVRFFGTQKNKKKYFSKMNSLYQISSKMLHSTKVIILVEKKEKRWPGWDLNSRPPC